MSLTCTIHQELAPRKFEFFGDFFEYFGIYMEKSGGFWGPAGLYGRIRGKLSPCLQKKSGGFSWGRNIHKKSPKNSNFLGASS